MLSAVKKVLEMVKISKRETKKRLRGFAAIEDIFDKNEK